MPKMVESKKQISTERTRVQNEPAWISKVDIESACSQLKLSKETGRHCNFAISGRNMNGIYRYKKGIYGLSDNPTMFQRKQTKQ